MKIKATCEIINSKRDLNGNTYWAFSYLDHGTGKSVEATISGGESNITAIRRHLFGDDSEALNFLRVEMPIRQFDKRVKNWPYAACRPEEIAAFIKKGIA